MLADEPTGNLDSAATLDVLRLFDGLHAGRPDAGHRHPRRADRRHRRPADLDARRRVRRRDPADRRHHGTAGRRSPGWRADRGHGPCSSAASPCATCAAVPPRPLLLLLVITAAATTLTLGLAPARRDQPTPTSSTRAATAGPDVVADCVAGAARRPRQPRRAGPRSRRHRPQRTVPGRRTPPAEQHGDAVTVQAEGRDTAPASVDQPELTQGSWVREGGVVVERSLRRRARRARRRPDHAGRPVIPGRRRRGHRGHAAVPDVRARPGLAHPGGCPALVLPLPRFSTS